MPVSFFPAASATRFDRRDLLVCVALYAAALAVMWLSPVTVVGDSRYTLLLTQNLLTKGGFALDKYGLPRNPPLDYGAAKLDGKVYQLEYVDGHLYYYFPPGSSILSAPFMLAQDALGYPVVTPDGSYNVKQEEKDQRFIAAALMAALAVTFYLTARLVVPVGWSVVAAAGGTLGTQVWSTASRALWNHTWGTVLIACVLYLLLSRETGRRPRLPPVLLATLLSWAYFVRPTNSLLIIGVTIYLLWFHREGFLRYALTGAAWFAAFVGYSWWHFGRVMPSYFAAARLETSSLPEALAGNLISPSRGLQVFVPVVLFVVYLILRYWRYRQHTRLLGLAAGVSTCHYVAVSGFVPWYGGGCYGPRYTTELVPWLVLAAALGVAAALRWREDYSIQHNLPAWRGSLAAGGVLLGLSMLINAHGATDKATKLWNEFPRPVDAQPSRVWEWSYPQFLAGFIAPPLPREFPVVKTGERVFFGHEKARPLQHEGWRDSDADGCWTAEPRTVLIFAVDNVGPRWLRLNFGAWVHPPQVLSQRVAVRLNDQPVGELTGRSLEPRSYALALPAGALLPDRNILTFDMPDAVVPASLGVSTDTRALGISLRWLEITDVEPTPEPTAPPDPTPTP